MNKPDRLPDIRNGIDNPQATCCTYCDGKGTYTRYETGRAGNRIIFENTPCPICIDHLPDIGKATCKDCGAEYNKVIGTMECPECEGELIDTNSEVSIHSGKDGNKPTQEAPREEKLKKLQKLGCTKQDITIEDFREAVELCEQQQARITELEEEKQCCHCNSKDIGFFTCARCETKEDDRYRETYKENEKLKEDHNKMLETLKFYEVADAKNSIAKEAISKLNYPNTL